MVLINQLACKNNMIEHKRYLRLQRRLDSTIALPAALHKGKEGYLHIIFKIIRNDSS